MSLSQSFTIRGYQLRPGGTPARLAVFRAIAADSVNNRNESTRLRPDDWRKARDYNMGSYAAAYCHGLGAGRQGNTPIWHCHTGENFRGEKDAGGPGWYTDSDCHDTAIGIIARLTHGRFLAGYRWTSNDERVYFPDIFTDETGAARMADEHARVFAESAREDSDRFTAMSLAELDAEEKLIEVQKAFALRHRAKFGGPNRVREAIESLRNARETLADATRAYERG